MTGRRRPSRAAPAADAPVAGPSARGGRAGTVTGAACPPHVASQRRPDELATGVTVALMPATAATLPELLAQTLRELAGLFGVLGSVELAGGPWAEVETNALQAVASLVVQLQARIDAEERLRRSAHHDELTALPNRRSLLEELDRRRHHVPEQPTALLHVGLDRFQTINDAFGHGAGDQMLAAAGDRLRAVVGPGGFTARLGGDEFVVLVDDGPSCAPGDLADELLRAVAEPIEVAGHHITRTASIGIAVSPSHSSPGEGLLTHADAAFRLAKRQGGNRAVLFDERLGSAIKERSDVEVLLREAIDGRGLALHYQPELDLRSGELLAVEALVRWDHPTRGILGAGSFIAAAEETGLVVDLGRWVLAEACRQMAVWRARHPGLHLTMRVNVSPAQLATDDIVGLVAGCLAVNRLPGRALCLEVTEHAVLRDVDQAVRTLHDLKALGAQLALDDFGTGFSSMSQLKRLPVDTLKIDQSFVVGLGADRGDRAIVEATVRLAAAFGLDVVAEGVESVEVVHELLALGCHRAQGFLLGRPRPPAELALLLAGGGIDPVAFTTDRRAVPPGARARPARARQALVETPA